MLRGGRKVQKCLAGIAGLPHGRLALGSSLLLSASVLPKNTARATSAWPEGASDPVASELVLLVAQSSLPGYFSLSLEHHKLG